MLFPRQLWPGLADGTVTVAFRRWKRPTVKAGGTLQTPGGLLSIDDIAVIGPEAITDEEARAAGFADRDEVLTDLRREGELYRIRFHRLGDDPRIALRQRSELGDAERGELRRSLARLPWALPILQVIAERPGVVSTTLAAGLDVERDQFKQRVRRLKALGLTESLEVGYRLSPRGRAALDVLRTDGGGERR